MGSQIVASNNLTYAEARGLEQLLIDGYGGKHGAQLLNINNGISPRNLNLGSYIEAGEKLLEEALLTIAGGG